MQNAFHLVNEAANLQASLDRQIRVLVVDDDQTNRLVLRNMLLKAGYDVSEAGNGQDAIQLYEQHEPDVVLMDVMMPVMDGYEAARRIKVLAGKHFVPIIFLTALTEEKALTECIECGGDDFLTKPYNRNILKIKLNAALRVRKLYGELERHNQKIEKHNEYMRSEQEAAVRIFNKMLSRGCLHDKCFNFQIASAALFNGDMLLASKLPDGAYRVLLGDFTGHGLSAAVGTIPIAEMFYTMSAKGCPLTELVREINRKLHTILPAEVFLSACLADITPDTLRIWNGGIPDVFIYDENNRLQRYCSQHPPLGIVSAHELNPVIEQITIDKKTRIYIYSDGVIEATDNCEAQFGEDHLLALLQEYDGDTVSRVWRAIADFTETAEQHDDMTMIEILPGLMAI